MLKILSKFRRSRSGLAAVEFALVLPVLLVMVFGAIEVTDAVICETDVSDTASSAADLIAQESSVGTADMNNVFSALSAMVFPFPVSNLQIVITSAVDDGHGGAIVDWSKANSGTARTQGSPVTVPTGLITTGGSVILTEVTYNFVPPTNWLIKIPLTMTNNFFSHPRRVAQVKWTS